MSGLHGATHAGSQQWAGIRPSAPNCATARYYNLIETAGFPIPCPGSGSKLRLPAPLPTAVLIGSSSSSSSTI